MPDDNTLFRRLERRLGAATRRRVESHQSLVSFDEEHGPNYLLEKIRSQDSKPENVRGGSEFIHGSSLPGLCARREVLANLSNDTIQRSVFPADRIVWALGRAAEKHVREQFITARKREGVIGSWHCKCEKTRHEGLYNHHVRCSSCRTRASYYGEIALFDHEAKIVGNPDMPYIRPDNYKVRITEIKSMNVKDFNELTAPLPDHVMQASIYRRLLQVNQMDADDGVTIFYVCKDYRVKAPRGVANQQGGVYKEFHVTPSANTETLLDGMWERAKTIRDWKMANGTGTDLPLPPRLPACSSSSAPTAKKCERCTACFARP